MPLLYEDMGQRATADRSIIDPAGHATSAARPCTTSATLPHARADPRAVARRARRARHVTRRRWCRRSSASSEMLKVKPIRAGRGEHAQQQDPRGLREARLPRLRHEPQPRELHAVGLLPARLPVRRQAEHADDLRPGGRARRARASSPNCARASASSPRRGPRARASRCERRRSARTRARAPFDVAAKVVVLCAGAHQLAAISCCAAASPTRAARSAATCICIRACCSPGIFDEDIYGYRGIPQSYYVDEFIDLEKDPRSGYILMPVYGFPVMTAAQLPGFGRDALRDDAELHRMVGILVLHARPVARAGGAGAIARPAADRLPVDDRGAAALRSRGCEHCAEILFAGGAREVLVPYDAAAAPRAGATTSRRSTRRRGGRPNEIPIASTHPQSTCRMGEDRAGGGQLVLPVARSARPLRLRHERLPDVARRPAADHDRRARGPHRAAPAGAVPRARGVSAQPAPNAGGATSWSRPRPATVRSASGRSPARRC